MCICTSLCAWYNLCIYSTAQFNTIISEVTGGAMCVCVCVCTDVLCHQKVVYIVTCTVCYSSSLYMCTWCVCLYVYMYCVLPSSSLQIQEGLCPTAHPSPPLLQRSGPLPHHTQGTQEREGRGGAGGGDRKDHFSASKANHLVSIGALLSGARSGYMPPFLLPLSFNLPNLP